jgi:peptide/nickel transport system ATP-binding protein
MRPALEIAGLHVHAGTRALVEDASLSLAPGSVLVVLGESGSGKSLLAQAVMGTLPPDLVASGRIVVDGEEVGRLDARARRALWGRRIALLPQEPWSSLDPLMAADEQVAEVHALVRGRPWGEARAMARRALAGFGLAGAERRLPFRLSGGMAQRVAIAVTDAAGAPLLIADEPTKGLDADRRDEVADGLIARARGGAAVVVITHDVALAHRLGGEVAVMLEARIVERGETRAVLDAPRHEYTRRLVASDPAAWPRRASTASGDPVVAGQGLAKALGGRTLFEGLSVSVAPGEIVAVAGPSGCGKTTLGNLILGMLAPDAGRVVRRGGEARHRFQKIYQDPVAAFAPRASLRTALDDVIRLHGLSWHEAEGLLRRMRIAPDLLERRPDQVSGGELQRIALARALLVSPVFLFADEATSRLDPVTQKEVVDLLTGIVAERRLGMLLVTHDHVLAERVADRVVGLGPAATEAMSDVTPVLEAAHV